MPAPVSTSSEADGSSGASAGTSSPRSVSGDAPGTPPGSVSDLRSPSAREQHLQRALEEVTEARDLALEECRRLQAFGKRGLETGEAGSVRVQTLERELADAMARI